MFLRLRVITGFFVLAFSLGQSTDACASCNAFPSYSTFLARQATLRTEIAKTVPQGMPFRGERGRINTGILGASLAEGGPEVPIELSTDPECQRSLRSLSDDDRVFVALMSSDGDTPQAVEVHATTNADCDAFIAAWRPPATVSVTCQANLEQPRKREDGAERYSFRLDSVAAAAAAKGTPAPYVTALLVTVPRKPSDTNTFAAALSAALPPTAPGKSCADLVASDDVRICVDRIYSDFRLGPHARCGVTAADMEIGLCRLTGWADWNYFDRHCRGTKCRLDTSANLHFAFAQLACGALALPMDYGAIRSTTETHRLRGRCATARSDTVNAVVVIPGDEFLASIRPGADPGNSKKPEVTVDNGSHAQELEIQGTVEENRSVVLLLPRLPSSLICDAPGSKEEACQTFESGSTDIQCSDTARNCRNLPNGPAYFYCEPETSGESYGYTGMPCTRREHCTLRGAHGTCTGRAGCVKVNAAWTGERPPGTKACDTDASCNSNSEQCGYSLFDFTSRSRTYRTSRRGQRGMCIDSSNNSQDVCAVNADCADGQSCEGYVLLDEGLAK